MFVFDKWSLAIFFFFERLRFWAFQLFFEFLPICLQTMGEEG